MRRDDYLAAIYRLSEAGLEVRLTDVASELGVRASTAARVLSRLERKGYVARKGATYHLTERGLRTALEVLKRHRVIERFLADVLGADLNEVHALAHELEHAERFAELVDAYLKRPKRCPHGNPVPGRASAKSRYWERGREKPLSVVTEGSYVIARICELREAMDYTWKLGLRAGDVIEVTGFDEKSVHLSVGSRAASLPMSVARLVFVEVYGNASPDRGTGG